MTSTTSNLHTGLIEDAVGSLNWLHQRADVDPSKIIVYGRSLGGAVAAALVARQKEEGRLGVKGLICKFNIITRSKHDMWGMERISIVCRVWMYGACMHPGWSPSLSATSPLLFTPLLPVDA